MTALAPLPLSFDEAKELTAQIKSATVDLWQLVVRAHDGKAWAAIGYDSFPEYCRQEFQMSKQRAHQLLDYAAVRKSLGISDDESTALTPTEFQTRPLTTLDTADEQREALADAQQTAAATGKPVTAKVVKAAVAKVRAKRNGAAPVEHAPAVPLEQALQEPTSSVEDAVWQIDFNAEHASPAQLEEAISHLFQRLAPRKKLLVIVRLFHELATAEREQFGKLLEAAK